ncbi:MAG: hypothetical protein B7Y40_02305 [Gammaproteobacteria bacterium 28-57-27]|nr:MAG: hypothetical protein B7Y40_02305 [Gammaproteobacteria bacterium 28-57-27]
MPHTSQPRDKDIAAFLQLSNQCENAGLEHLLAASQLVGRIRPLIHALQRERGVSNLFLNSHGECYAARMHAYRKEGGIAETHLRQELMDWRDRPRYHLAGSRLYANIALALHGLSELPELRAKIDDFTRAAPEAMQAFSELIRRLLGVVFEAADMAADPAISRALVALLNFMQGKELAGQERAIGVAGFSQGWRGDGEREALMNRIDAQERCFQIFTEFADDAHLARWQQLTASPLTAEVERLRRIACTQRPDLPTGRELAQLWFEQATRRIDAMKEIEDALEIGLHDLCCARLTQSHAPQDEPAELERATDDALPVGVVLGRPVDTVDPELLLDVERRHIEGRAPMGRSLIELVQTQSRRLQTMQDELKAAHEALDERKLIEQAKALLIKHRGMNEDEAHRLLRKTAMDQGKRLIEVARAAIAMSEMLGARF